MNDKLATSAKKTVATANRELKKLRCIPQDKWFGGVCSGVAYRLGAPTWVIRIAWFLAASQIGRAHV